MTKILNFTPKSVKPAKSVHSVNPALKLVKKETPNCPECGDSSTIYLDFKTLQCIHCMEIFDE